MAQHIDYSEYLFDSHRETLSDAPDQLRKFGLEAVVIIEDELDRAQDTPISVLAFTLCWRLYEHITGRLARLDY